MLVVHKFVFDNPEMQFDLPLNAQVLSVGRQGTGIVMWVLLDPDPQASKRPRYFGCINTGVQWEQKDKIFNFLGTVTIEAIVWHIFEVTKKPGCILNSHDAIVAAGDRCPQCLEKSQ